MKWYPDVKWLFLSVALLLAFGVYIGWIFTATWQYDRGFKAGFHHRDAEVDVLEKLCGWKEYLEEKK